VIERNHLQGKDGDRMNAILSGLHFNLRTFKRPFFLSIFQWHFHRNLGRDAGWIDPAMSDDHVNEIASHAFLEKRGFLQRRLDDGRLDRFELSQLPGQPSKRKNTT
jgi:hypothetical protein